MQVKIHELANKEFQDAIEWYEHQSAGLGRRFKLSIIEQINKIKRNPRWYLTEEGAIFKSYIPNFLITLLYYEFNF